MIGRLTGKVLEAEPGRVLLDVSGVGYEVEVPLSTYYQIQDLTETCVLHIQMIVREDAQLLFGFATTQERELFRILIKVNSVGPKLAVNILSGIEPAAFAKVVTQGDVKALVALPGVGKKTAEKIILEVKDRLPDFGQSEAVVMAPASDAMADAEAALIGLGFKPQDAARILAQIESEFEDDEAADTETLIKTALKRLT